MVDTKKSCPWFMCLESYLSCKDVYFWKGIIESMTCKSIHIVKGEHWLVST